MAILINNWSLVYNRNPYLAPELLGIRLQGNVSNHPRFPDNHPVVTSQVEGLEENNHIKTVSGSVYELGDVDPEYEKEFPNARQRIYDVLQSMK